MTSEVIYHQLLQEFADDGRAPYDDLVVEHAV